MHYSRVLCPLSNTDNPVAPLAGARGFGGPKGLALGNAQGIGSAVQNQALKGLPKMPSRWYALSGLELHEKSHAFNPGRLAWAVIERRFAAQNLEAPALSSDREKGDRRVRANHRFLLILLPFLVVPAVCRAAQRQGGASAVTPQALSARRVKLYFQAAHQPMGKLAPEIYEFAADSEHCRLDSGAKACGLPTYPLKGTDLKQIYNYYVVQPVEAVLAGKQVKVSKNTWSWQTRQ